MKNLRLNLLQNRVAAPFRVPRATQCSAGAVEAEVLTFGFNDEGVFMLLTEEDAWKAMATGYTGKSSTTAEAPAEDQAAEKASTEAAAAVAKQEAQAWIAAWREGQVVAKAVEAETEDDTSSTAAEEAAAAAKQEAQAWIAAWRAAQPAVPEGEVPMASTNGASGSVPGGAAEARAWIQAWRDKQPAVIVEEVSAMATV